MADDPLVMPQDEFDLVRKLADATKACGCGPVEPCKPHLGAGDLQDWEGRARAAEAKLAALRVLIGNPGWATPAEVQRKALAIIGGEKAGF